jgi:hypothetical protein
MGSVPMFHPTASPQPWFSDCAAHWHATTFSHSQVQGFTPAPRNTTPVASAAASSGGTCQPAARNDKRLQKVRERTHMCALVVLVLKHHKSSFAERITRKQVRSSLRTCLDAAAEAGPALLPLAASLKAACKQHATSHTDLAQCHKL